MLRWLVLFLLAGVPWVANAARPPLVVPSDPGTLLEKLPRGYAALVGPVAPAQVKDRVDRLLATAATTGDARLVARADRLLSSLPPAQSSVDVLKARAYVAQFRHQFSAALELLDAVVVGSPRDGGARLARAQLHLVMGHLQLARADCAALLLGVDADRAQLCIAAIALRHGDTDTAANLTKSWLQQAAPETSLRRYVVSMRAEAAARAGAADADAWFRQLLALAPGDVRSLAPYARYLRAAGRNREVLDLLRDARDNDALQLQEALAAHAAHLPEAPALVEAMARRYRLAHTLGTDPELRDEAEFLLVLRSDAAGALALASRNFISQRDYEDVDILCRAALAANRPEELEPLREWARSQELVLPALPGGGA